VFIKLCVIGDLLTMRCHHCRTCV